MEVLKDEILFHLFKMHLLRCEQGVKEGNFTFFTIISDREYGNAYSNIQVCYKMTN